MTSVTRPGAIQARRHDLLITGLADAIAAGTERDVREVWDGIADAATEHADPFAT